MKIRHVFRKIAHATAAAIGSPYAFITAVSAVVIWAACGPVFHYSDTWQLVINTSTTIVTFLVVFMIQNSQNRDSQAIHLKLDELICAVKTARNRLVDVEDLDDEEIAQLAQEFRKRRDQSAPDAPRPDARAGANEDEDEDGDAAQAGKPGDEAAAPAERREPARDEAAPPSADGSVGDPCPATPAGPSRGKLAERTRAAGRAD